MTSPSEKLTPLRLSGRGVRRLSGINNLQTAMPIGGLGAGNVCFSGEGSIQDFSIRNRPASTMVPDDTSPGGDAFFATLHIKGKHSVTRLVEGPLPPEKIYAWGTQSSGFRRGGYEGLPRFAECIFVGAFPFGQVKLKDPELPVKVEVTAWNPFLPLDDVNSGIPVCVLEYAITNTSSKPQDIELGVNLSHPCQHGATHETTFTSLNAVIPGRGVVFSNDAAAESAWSGTAALVSLGEKPRIKAMWFRGGWFDSISVLWKEVSSGGFTTNQGKNAATASGRNGGSILLEAKIPAGETQVFPVAFVWHFPNCDFRSACATPQKEPESACCGEDETCESQPVWNPFYSTLWRDASEVAAHVITNFDSLRNRTLGFQKALFSSTLPAAVLDAVSSNLAILKSPTVLRQASGNIWGWEGCFVQSGCCPGTCTHVWNYAQSLPHLFPALERTIREQEFLRSMDEQGLVTFRAALPDGPPEDIGHAAADGQLGGLMKLYRDWQISGNDDWLRSLFPAAKRSMNFCIEHWDPTRRGAIEEPHHNTYDIEFWGPDGMCTSMYLGALSAMAAIADHLGENQDATAWSALAKKAAYVMETELFNGTYFQQKVEWKALRTREMTARLAETRNADPSAYQLLRDEGPKYQYGSGCLSDGVIGAWMATLYQIDTPLKRNKVRSTLRSIHRHNFKASLRHHANPQRPGYAVGDEPGLLLCTWPRGGKPTLPFVYCDEAWPGIEYQVASHLISEGMVEEGLEIVRALRSRFDGRVRNPWNEYECGSYYARSMASYALLQALTGFHYSAPTQTVTLAPKIPQLPLVCFFSTATGWGTFTINRSHQISFQLVEGHLDVSEIRYKPHGSKEKVIMLQPEASRVR